MATQTNNVTFIQAGVNYVMTAAAWPYFSLKYSLPVYDPNTDLNIHTDPLTSITSAVFTSGSIADTASTPALLSNYGFTTLNKIKSELLFNGFTYSTPANTTRAYVSGNQTGGGATKYLFNTQSAIKYINQTIDGVLNDFNLGSNIRTSGTNLYSETDWSGSESANATYTALSTAATWDRTNLYDNVNYIPETEGSDVVGNYQVVYDSSVGPFRFNKIVLFAQKYSTATDIDNTTAPVPFAIISLATSIDKRGVGEVDSSVTSFIGNFKLKFTPYSGTVEVSANPDQYWAKHPGTGAGTSALCYPGSIMLQDISGSPIVENVTKSKIHLLEPSGKFVRMQYGSGTGYRDIDVNSVGNVVISQTTTAQPAISIGYLTSATGSCAATIGQASSATGSVSLAIGSYNTASGSVSFAAGNLSSATNTISTSFGSATLASGPVSTTFGSSTTASGNVSTAFGSSTKATGINSTSFGSLTTAQGENSVVSGDHSKAIGNNSLSCGYYTSAIGDSSISLGYTTQAFGSRSIAIGYNNISSGANSVAIGSFNRSIGSTSFSAGSATSAEGFISTAFGASTKATGSYSTTFGRETIASGTRSLGGGYQTQATGTNSLAFGDSTTASGENSLAFGLDCTASGKSSMAVGSSAYTIGDASAAFGVSVNSFGTGSFATGFGITAAANYNSIFGFNAGSVQTNSVPGSFMWIDNRPGDDLASVQFNHAWYSTDYSSNFTSIELVNMPKEDGSVETSKVYLYLDADTVGQYTLRASILSPAGGAKPGAGIVYYPS